MMNLIISLNYRTLIKVSNRDSNSKFESFGCAKKNASGLMLKNVQKQLNLIYVNNDEHAHMDRANGSTDLL